jgi:hypothetical protein
MTSESDPTVKAAREGRNGQILAAVITGLAGVVVASMTYLAGHDQGASQAAESTPAPTVTVTVTATVPHASTPGPGQTVPAGGGERYLEALTPTGAAPTKGAQRINGQAYRHSLGFTTDCGGSTFTTVFDLGAGHQRFQSVVGLAEADDTEESVTFVAYADNDEDGEPDREEQIGSVAAQLKRPAWMDVRLNGASVIILRIEAESCFSSTAVWADPRVS